MYYGTHSRTIRTPKAWLVLPNVAGGGWSSWRAASATCNIGVVWIWLGSPTCNLGVVWMLAASATCNMYDMISLGLAITYVSSIPIHISSCLWGRCQCDRPLQLRMCNLLFTCVFGLAAKVFGV